MNALTLPEIDQLTGGRPGIHDVPCPYCGPRRRSPANRVREVLRVWRNEATGATYSCIRCGMSGGAAGDRAGSASFRMPVGAARPDGDAEKQRYKARGLWGQRVPIGGTPAEVYLREVRGCKGPLQPTLGYLPAQGEFPPTLIAALGLPEEPEPGRLSIATEQVMAVHLTRLQADGRGKAGTDTDKIIIGRGAAVPIVVAPPNDLGGLAVTEGIEDALSVAEATGLGAWAAGSWTRMAALGALVPLAVEYVTVMVDDDPGGRRGAADLLHELERRGISARAINLGAAS